MIHKTSIRLLAIAMLAAALLGCRSGESPTSPVAASNPPANGPADPWILSTTDPKNLTPAVLWNGLIGVRIGRGGDSTGQDKNPLPFYLIDQYETTGEEKMREFKGLLTLEWSDGSPFFVAEDAKDYEQSLDLRTGLLTTRWTSRSQEFGVQTIQSEMLIHPTKRTFGIRVIVDAEKETGNRRLLASIAGTAVDAAIDFNSGFPRGVLGSGQAQYKGRLQLLPLHPPSPQRTNRPSFELTISLGGTNSGISMATARTGIAAKMPHDYFEPDLPPSFEDLRQQTADYWSKAWETDIEIDGPVEDQQAVRSFLFYLRSAIHPDGKMSISPFALSNARYNGHVFWDADVWVFPALALIDPDRAKAMPRYRLATAKPKRIGEFRGYGPQFTLQFPWESSVTGLETAPPEMRREIHVTGGALNMLHQAKALGLTDVDLAPIKQAIANYYRSEASFDPGKDGEYRFKDVISPDEFHKGDNDLYTNLVASWIEAGTVFFKRADGHLDSEDSIPVYLPRDSTTFLTYDGDPLNRKYKQAAAVLAIFPLQFPAAEAEARLMMDRYADMVTPNGPAMSDSVHATIWARLGEKEKAYQTWRKSWQRYTNHPLMLFSEKPAREETYFTTGAAGCLQTVLYGFLGFRIDYKKESGALWSKPLSDGQVLSVKPNLPPEWKSVTLKNFTVLGKRYTLTATRDSAKVAEAR